MTTVTTLGARLPLTAELRVLLDDIISAERRASKSEPGERTDIVMFEALCSALEAKAAAAVLTNPAAVVPAPATSTLTAGLYTIQGADLTVALTLPLEPGQLVRSAEAVQAPKPATVVEIRDDIRGRELVERRFRDQLEAALTTPAQNRSSVLSPSGINNRVLTEVLRAYVNRQDGERTQVPVVYRDGSQAQATFPFRSLDLTDEMRDGAEIDLDLRLTLLSIRHTEMDPVVDGAWLRNAEVSKPRPAAQTDDYVHQTSVKQLRELTHNGVRRLRLYVFQTGLETAVVGFYRAVTEFLIAHPGQLEVVPMFYAEHPKLGITSDQTGFEPGRVWTTRS